MMRRKHHYTIKKIKYFYDGDWFDSSIKTTKETVVFITKKRAIAEKKFYELTTSNGENGTIYKGIYYPNVEYKFIKDY